MRILVIAPHMDDEVLGVGGTIAKHVAEGDEVFVCFIAHRVYDHRYDEEKNKTEMQCALKAKEILGYKEANFFNLSDERLDGCTQEIIMPLEQYVKKVNPEVVYLCHHGDNNQDHRAVFQAAMVVLRPIANLNIKKVLCYEVPSSTEQAPALKDCVFLANVHVDIEQCLKTKIEALSCYKTELREFPHPRSVRGIEVLAMKRGSEVGFKAAEAFMLIREKSW
jgi:LmbE family N-acetylglucosaminyl deacetylase